MEDRSDGWEMIDFITPRNKEGKGSQVTELPKQSSSFFTCLRNWILNFKTKFYFFSRV